MDQFGPTVDDLLPVLALPFPLAMLTTAASLVLRSFLGTGSQSRDPFVDGLLLYCGVLVAGLVFSPQPEVAEQTRLYPGADVVTALRAAPGDVAPWVQLVGNLLLLFPLGALAPMRLPVLDSAGRLCAAAFVTACGIELTQLLLVSGRVVSTDDIVLNALGATAGGVLTKRWRRVSRSQHGSAGGGYPVEWLITEIEKERRAADRTPARRT
ncbi:VanZ like protein [Saccharopolyspora erythraea NRRL 2338]|uniref:VanZ-like domain-containing protein n=2 Tax=Saccharopolyspora erythraea TaxID=1836 RepID=A4FC91_SACEN|nr:VanZ family protein [Saccharopolyspora erythraea]EQD82421.1 hypothetical protein N599_30760 [Saccharopolyspora erythraea D]PFG95428.1 VanZ like protein [Saccharopolyspora erythraea NRRL 2338]QRK92066.1 VanZ family protein [Saccharopolyspora erythraea]CAM01666.1 hypothetical protein SACE_2366 [Saccharopolyspora erythraea NRRL 2338]